MKVLHFEATYLNRAGATCHQPNLYADTFRAARLSLEIFGATEVALKCLEKSTSTRAPPTHPFPTDSETSCMRISTRHWLNR